MQDEDFADRLVLVFGAGGALGAGVAAAFTAAGASVTGVDKAESAENRRLAGVRYEAVNVLDYDAVGALFDSAAPPWAVINTVGGFATARPLSELASPS
jgi:NAD(P)-dependent dehydrogenase (short-subunit alcohol dehydrogenase family)